MITLQTGLPGSGKTLYTLYTVNRKSIEENRPVFYDGIADLTLPNWTKIDAEKWFECPPNSLIVIDECQRIFRPRTISKEVPQFVSELETHRHKGLDLWMITQHPMLADSALRRLSGKHIHAIRPFGFNGASLHEWPSVKDSCDKASGRTDSIKTKWAYDKKTFGVYKSAEVHTVKRAIPFKVKMLFVLPVLIGALGFVYYRSVMARIHPDAMASSAPGQTSAAFTGQGAGASGGSGAKASYKNAKDDSKQYLFEHEARVAGWESSAPRYDELTKPVRVPLPAACLSSARGCNCYTQQGTPANVSAATCLAIVEKGFFVDFDSDPKRGVSDNDAARGGVGARDVSYSSQDDKKSIRNIVASNDNAVHSSLLQGDSNGSFIRRGTVGGKSRIVEGAGSPEGAR